MVSLLASWLNLQWSLLVALRPQLLFILALYGLITLAETRYPAEPGQGWRGRGLNLLLGAQYFLLGNAGLAAWYLLLPLPPLPTPESHRPVTTLLLILTALLIVDFLFYWYHRLQHRWAWLWAIHELHHSDEALNVTSSFRTYWLERPLQAALIGLPMALLMGAHRPAGLWFLAATTALLLFSHANLRLSLGPLTPVVVGPQLHRLHHARAVAYHDCNFAQYFPLLDVLFGTYRAPGRGEFPATGVDGVAGDAGLGWVLARPFRLWGIGQSPL